MTDTLAVRVRTLVSRMAPDNAVEADDGQLLVRDLGFDSIRLMELTVALEKAFELPRHQPHQLAEVQSVGDVVDMVLRETSDGSANG